MLHTLWQAPLIAAGLYGLLRLVPAAHVRTRYALASTSLVGVAMAGLVTWSVLDWRAQKPYPAPADNRATAPLGEASPQTDIMNVTETPSAKPPAIASPPRPSHTNSYDWSVPIGLVWLVGVGVMLIRLAVQITGVYRLTRSAGPRPRRQACQGCSGLIHIRLADHRSRWLSPRSADR